MNINKLFAVFHGLSIADRTIGRRQTCGVWKGVPLRTVGRATFDGTRKQYNESVLTSPDGCWPNLCRWLQHAKLADNCSALDNGPLFHGVDIRVGTDMLGMFPSLFVLSYATTESWSQFKMGAAAGPPYWVTHRNNCYSHDHSGWWSI